jgi:DNA-binding LacI/PurR family transcriptional regulator
LAIIFAPTVPTSISASISRGLAKSGNFVQTKRMTPGKLVHDAEGILRTWLAESGKRPGERLPSERLLGRQLGVRHYAINRAMAALVRDGEVRREGYKLFLQGEKLLSKADISCDLVISRRSSLLMSYRKTARDLGVSLRLHPYNAAEEAYAMLDHLVSDHADCVIFDPPAAVAPALWAPRASRLAGKGVPLVIVNKDSEDFTCVLSDGRRALEKAVLHLVKNSHGQLAFAAGYPSSADQLGAAEWRNVCRAFDLGKSGGRYREQANGRFLREDAREVADLLENEWRGVTALVISMFLEDSINCLLKELARHGWQIPRDLSLICVGDAKCLSICSPSVAAMAFEMSIVQEMAFRLAQTAVRRKAGGLPPSPPTSLLVEPRLIARQSIAPPKTARAGLARVRKQRSAEEPLPAEIFEPPSDPRQCLLRPYALVARAARTRFAPLDLSRQANRPLIYRRGWLGDLPLKGLMPGEQVIHGVPFQILGGNNRSDCGVVVFKSATNSTGKAERLPVRLAIPIRRKVEAVYILHGCGYAQQLASFATYSFKSGREVLASVPLVSLGQPPVGMGARDFSGLIARANVQDWWPDFPHVDFPHARMAPIRETDGHEGSPRHVYLYSLEWINPRPERPVTALEIVVDSSLSTTLGVLAVTLLGP